MDTALQACDRGALLTRQLLAFGRGQTLAPELCDINELLENSMDLYRRACAGSVRVALEPRDELPLVWVDRSQFEAAVLNLVANSRDAMPDGGCIRISASARSARNAAEAGSQLRQHVCVEVRDNGEGIDPAIQERVFNPSSPPRRSARAAAWG